MYGYIYKTTNLANNKLYIGQKKSEIFLGNKYLGSGQLLKKAIIKYGKDSFSVELLEKCDSKLILDSRERYWIKYFNTKNVEVGYNIASGGEGSNGGGFKSHKHSEASKQKISQSVSKYNQKYRKGKKMIDICGPNYINGMKGKEAKNKGTIRIYNEHLHKIKYMKKDDNINNYPGYIIGGPPKEELNLNYLNDINYIKQLKERTKNTRFIYNDSLELCKRVKENEIDNYLKNNWCLGRKIYKKKNK